MNNNGNNPPTHNPTVAGHQNTNTLPNPSSPSPTALPSGVATSNVGGAPIPTNGPKARVTHVLVAYQGWIPVDKDVPFTRSHHPTDGETVTFMSEGKEIRIRGIAALGTKTKYE